MSVDSYFELASGYARWFQNSPVALEFQKHGGKIVTLEQVKSWLKAWKIDNATSVHCYQTNEGAVFKEIRLYLSSDLLAEPGHRFLIDAPYTSQCPNKFFLEL